MYLGSSPSPAALFGTYMKIMETPNKLELVRAFNAPIEAIWRAWTDKEQFAKWYGSPGKLEEVRMELVVGGAWSCVTVMPDGERSPAVGVYRLINEPKELEFSFLNIEDLGDPNMHIILKEVDGKTEMKFTQSGNLPKEVYETGLKEGWTGFFDALENVLAE